jgi:hypothetical protein
VSRRTALALAAALTGIAAALVAGYAAARLTGLIDVASVAVLGALIVARGAVRGQKPPSVRAKNLRSDPARGPAVRVADFPAYQRIASDLEWAQMSRRHYEHALGPTLARLAAALGRPQAVAPDLEGPPSGDIDGPGLTLATLDRIVTRLEEP